MYVCMYVAELQLSVLEGQAPMQTFCTWHQLLAFMCRIGRPGCMNNSLNESYHSSVAFSPNPHVPNLCNSVLRCFPIAKLAAAADEPLSMETVEHFLRDQGFDVPQDLGGLRADEIVELLSPIRFWPLHAADNLCTRGKSCILKRDSRFWDPAQALPPKQQKLQMPASITSAACGTPSRLGRLAPDSAPNRTLELAVPSDFNGLQTSGCAYSAPIRLFCEHFYVNRENVEARCLLLCYGSFFSFGSRCKL